MGKPRIVAVDFDGVIDRYSGFGGGLSFGGPIQGVRGALGYLRRGEGVYVFVHTCRPDIGAVWEYLLDHKIEFDSINYSPRNKKQGLNADKLAADVYIDDKALTFEGRWDEGFVRRVLKFKEWWRE